MALNRNIIDVTTARSPVAIIGDVLRERGPDTIVYALSGHTPINPKTLTITSSLPVPRKGNAGTTKTLVALRHEVTLGKGTETEKNVPVIAKLETSFPVGTDISDILPLLSQLGAAVLMNEQSASDFFVSGLPLPIA